jgi:hypothetical protein
MCCILILVRLLAGPDSGQVYQFTRRGSYFIPLEASDHALSVENQSCLFHWLYVVVYWFEYRSVKSVIWCDLHKIVQFFLNFIASH